MVKERRCDVAMLAFLEECDPDACTIDVFRKRHEELYSHVKDGAIGGRIKTKLIRWDRPALLNDVLAEINLAVPIKDADLGMAFEEERSDETIAVLVEHMRRLRKKAPSRELLTHLIGGDFASKRHRYKPAAEVELA